MCSGTATYCEWPVTGLLDTEQNGSHVYDECSQATRLYLWYLYAVFKSCHFDPTLN